MSNMRDAVGLCMPYGKADIRSTRPQFEPATGTVWGYFNPKRRAVLQPRSC